MTCITNGRQATCGQTSPPRAAVASRIEAAPPSPHIPESSAVQDTGRPVDCEISANWSMKRSAPTVACMTPWPTSPMVAASASISAWAARRLGTGLPWAPACVGAPEVENPTAPASSAPLMIAVISATSASVASRSDASSPST